MPRPDAKARAARAAGAVRAWPTPATGRPRPTPAACAAGSTWPPAWSGGRRCCSSTSRPPGSTRAARNEVWEHRPRAAGDGVTVLLTTQYLEEADQLADDIAVIDHGRVIATGTPDELKAKAGGQVLEVRPADPAADRRGLVARGGRRRHGRGRGAHGHAVPVPTRRSCRRWSAGSTTRASSWPSWRCAASSLDEVFLSLTGHRAEDETTPPNSKEPGMTRPLTDGRCPPCRRVSPADALRQTVTLAWRSLVQIKHNPLELLDLSIQPIMFVLLFTYVFGGAISGSPRRLPAVRAARHHRAERPVRHPDHRRRAEHRPHQGRLRPAARRCRSPAGRRWPAGSWPTRSSRSGRSSLLLGRRHDHRVPGHDGVAGVLGAFALLLVFTLAVSPGSSVLVGVLVDKPGEGADLRLHGRSSR